MTDTVKEFPLILTFEEVTFLINGIFNKSYFYALEVMFYIVAHQIHILGKDVLNELKQGFGPAVTMLHEMRVLLPEFESQFCLGFQFPADIHPGRQKMMTQVLGSLLHT